jgi:hypothetical protein
MALSEPLLQPTPAVAPPPPALPIRPLRIPVPTPLSDSWSQPAPIHLAGYQDDPAEPHILRGLD